MRFAKPLIIALIVILSLLVVLAGAAYYFFGVDFNFIAGVWRSRVLQTEPAGVTVLPPSPPPALPNLIPRLPADSTPISDKPIVADAETPFIPPSAPPTEVLPPPGPPTARRFTSFATTEYFTGFNRPTAMTFDDQGRLLVGELSGRVWRLKDLDGDGQIDQKEEYAAGFDQ